MALLAHLVAGLLLPTQQITELEGEHTRVDHLAAPEGVVLEVGGMDWLPDGRLAVSTRRGEVWLVENALAKDPRRARFVRFAEGLWEGLGLRVVDGQILVLQRGELSRLRDLDGDDRCDAIDTLSYDWGLTENYHEFAYGLPMDAQGNAYITLNVGFFNPEWWLGRARAPYRGWALRIAPDGAVTPFASGFRSPCGVSLSPAGGRLVADNQGDWMPASPVFHVREGGFYGHPASLDWTPEYRASATQASLTVPSARAASDREPAALWLPYEWSRSPGNLVWDQGSGAFGAFAGQAYLAELTNGMVLRAGFEEIDGVTQGFVLPFRHRVGSAVRLLFASDGTLLAGLTNRGWGGLEPSDGIARVRWTGSIPMEVLDVRLVVEDEQPAFAVRFTHPLSEAWVEAARAAPEAAVRVHQYHYDYWWEYGSPERDMRAVEVANVRAQGDRELRLTIPGLEAGRVARVGFEGLGAQDGAALLHEEFAYTVNRLPPAVAGPGPHPHVARIVPPPPARESEEEGWLRMTYGDATDAWEQSGWELVSAQLDPDDPTRFRVGPGNSHLTNTGSTQPSDYVSRAVFGDANVHVEFTLPEGGAGTVWLMGRYGIRLQDDGGAAEPTGTLLPHPGGAARLPLREAYRGAGQLHELDLEFEAPRFDPGGRKLRSARLLRAQLDEVLLHEMLELEEPGRGAPRAGEAALGPLVISADGPIAIGNIRVQPRTTPRPTPEEGDGWTWLIDPDDEDALEGWTRNEDARWTLEDEVLIGEGPRGHLVSPRSDYADFELWTRVKISDGGNAGLILRADGTLTPAGYEAEINSSFASPHKSGSLLGLTSVRTHLVAPDTWFDYHLTCRTTPEGVRLSARINGVLVAEALDTERSHLGGHIALQQHHEGSVVEFQGLLIRER